MGCHIVVENQEANDLSLFQGLKSNLPAGWMQCVTLAPAAPADRGTHCRQTGAIGFSAIGELFSAVGSLPAAAPMAPDSRR